jgi:hypothetical protein
MILGEVVLARHGATRVHRETARIPAPTDLTADQINSLGAGRSAKPTAAAPVVAHGIGTPIPMGGAAVARRLPSSAI